MSAVTMALRTDAGEVPAVIAGSVNLMAFSEALARAAIVGRFDRERGVLAIEPAQGAQPKRGEPRYCPSCGGSGCDQDGPCEVCGGGTR